MVYLLGPYLHVLNDALANGLNRLASPWIEVFGALLGAVIAFDMGGPVNKVFYLLAVGLLTEQIYSPIACVMAAGMTPALGVGLATLLFTSRFSDSERRLGKESILLGLCFITEGAIPFARSDPFRVVPAIIVGSAATGALTMWFECQLRIPHGGLLAMLIPGAVTNLQPYLTTILIGTGITAMAIGLLKRPLRQTGAR